MQKEDSKDSYLKQTYKGTSFHQWGKCLPSALLCYLSPQSRKREIESALLLVKLDLAKRSTRHSGIYIQFHPITQLFARRRSGFPPAKAAVLGMQKCRNSLADSNHLWASAFLLFGFKSEPPLIQIKVFDMLLFMKKIAIPLAIRSFTTFLRCCSALELLKVSTDMLDEVEKSFVSQVRDRRDGSLWWKKRLHGNRCVDEHVWEEVTLLKASLQTCLQPRRRGT